MKHATVASIIMFLLLYPNASYGATLLSDTFSSSPLSSTFWRIPTWVSSTDGTYIDRTQFRVSQNSPLPSVVSGNVLITLDTYNPTGFSFYGTDLLSVASFAPKAGEGIHVKVRAKMDTPVTPGTVGGIFLYSLKPGSNTLHDEIDFELLGTRANQVQTNIYGNEPLGAGHPQFVTLPQGSSIGSYHLYEIKWFEGKVEWYIDGALVRTATANLPAGPMYLHLNMWAPNSGWAEAYSASIQPTNSALNNSTWSMSVDSVSVDSISTSSAPTASFSGAPTCSVASGASECRSTVVWTSANPTDGFVGLYFCGAAATSWLSRTTAGEMSNTSVYLRPDRKCLEIRDMASQVSLAQVTAVVSCAPKSAWYVQPINGYAFCMPQPTAVITNTPACTIPKGKSSCTATLSWTATTSTSVSNYFCNAPSGQFGGVSGSGPYSTTLSINPDRKCIQIRDFSTNSPYSQSVLAQKNATVACVAGSYWYKHPYLNSAYCR